MIFIGLLKAGVIQMLLAYKYPSTVWGVAKLDFDFFNLFLLRWMHLGEPYY